MGWGVGVISFFSVLRLVFGGKWGLGVDFLSFLGVLTVRVCVFHEKNKHDPIGDLHMLLRVTCFKVCVFSIGSCLRFFRNWVPQKSIVPFCWVDLGSILGAFWAPKSSKCRSLFWLFCWARFYVDLCRF